MRLQGRHGAAAVLQRAAARGGMPHHHRAAARGAAVVVASAATRHDVVIVGGGPGGLAAAHALSKVLPDASIHVCERNPDIQKPQGAGMSIDPNGLKALRAIDETLFSEIYEGEAAKDTTRIARVEVRNPEGGMISSGDTKQMASMHDESVAKYGLHSIQCGWHTLLMLLYNQLPPKVTLEQGAQVERYEAQEDGSISLHLQGRDEPLETRLLVVSDGAFSRVRRQLLDDEPLPDFMGTVIFRATATEDELVAAGFPGGTNIMYSGSDDVRILLFRIGGGRVAIAISMQASFLEQRCGDLSHFMELGSEDAAPTSSGSWELARRMDAKQAHEALLLALDGWDESLVRLVKDLGNEAWVAHGTYAREASSVTPEFFGRGNIVILGDAAHPFRPTGQGVNQTLEDAYLMAAAVARDPVDLSELDAFRAARAERVAPVMANSAATAAAAYDKSKQTRDMSKTISERAKFNNFLYDVEFDPLVRTETTVSSQ